MWTYLVIAVVFAVISFALRPRTPETPPPSTEDLSVPTAEEGNPIPVVFGRVLVTGPNVVWYGDLGYEEVRSESGGK